MNYAFLYVVAFALIAGSIGLMYFVLRGNARWWPADAFQWSAVGISAMVLFLSVVMLGLVSSVQRQGGIAPHATGSADVEAAELNAPVDDFEYRLVESDAPARFADLRGNVVLVNIWATWCAPCRFEMPELNRLQVDYRDAGLVVLNLSDEPRQDLITYHEELPLMTTSGYVQAEDVPEPFRRNFQVRPTSFIVDREGILRASVLGARSYDQFLALLDPYLKTTEASAL